jgi:DNA-binding MarR family transcriptional regulator
MKGDRLGMDTGTITPLVKRLETAGMLTRTRDPFDERRVLVDLTEASRALEYELHGITGKIQSTCEMTNSEIDDLHVRLEKLARPAD